MNTYGILIDKLYAPHRAVIEADIDIERALEKLPTTLPGEVRLTLTYQPIGLDRWFTVQASGDACQWWAENKQHAIEQAEDYFEHDNPVWAAFKANTP